MFIFTCLALSQAYANQWEQLNKEDAMGGGIDEISSIKSENSFELQAPYQGVQHAKFILRKAHDEDNKFLITIEKGQFVCGIDGCYISARIDAGTSFPLRVSPPKDGSTNILIGDLSPSLKREVIGGKKLLIESTIFQNGELVFEFKIEKTPFSGKNGYPLNELIKMRDSGSGMPELKNNHRDIDLDTASFKICKLVINSNNEDSVTIVNLDTKNEFSTTEYKEYFVMKQRCKKGIKKILINFYDYK